MGCEALVVKARILNIIDADVNICLQNDREPRKLRRSGDDEYNECDDIVARLRLLGLKVDANVCLGIKGSNGWSKEHIDRLECTEIIARAKVLGIIKADVNVCLDNILNLGHSRGANDDGGYNECNDIVARLRLLGLKVDVNVCLGTRGSKGWSKDRVDRLECDDIVAHAKVLGILKADVNVCLRNVLNLGHPRRSNDEDYNECDNVVARLRLLGLKVNANVCLGIKGSNGWSKEYVDRLECADIVAHAKILGIIKADANICLGNILNLGHSQGSNGDGEYNECSDIAAYLRLLGLKVDANVCLGIRGSKGWSKDRVDKSNCDDIVAHAKVLGILKVDVNVCLGNILNLGHSRGSDGDEYNECPDIAARLRILGLKLDADVCIGVKSAGGWTKDDLMSIFA
ncbi:hypothetical protein K7432_018244 [Basidiobolus ranarum]|uniref:Xylose isomerase-like TIM barrel domain-containing protein n=1 Tax=Basidiobolus ranarum TaxID=34480 RepID=A0ABR2WCE8_9FUNG